MLYNKNNVRKTNDKKILHKVGKQWKVVSIALLLAIGGGAAVAANNTANANADANNGLNANDQAEINSLEQGPTEGQSSAPASQSSQASSASGKAPVAPNFDNLRPDPQYNGNNASAAKSRILEGYDKAVVKYYGGLVNSYVSSINSKFPSQASSVNSNYTSASNQQNNDRSKASSYAATYHSKDWSAEVSNIASAKSGIDATDFINNVSASAKTLAHNVSTASDNISGASSVASYAALISEINANPLVSGQYSNEAFAAGVNATIASKEASNAEKVVNNYNEASEQAFEDAGNAKNDAILNSAENSEANFNSNTDYNTMMSIAGSTATHSLTSTEISSVNSAVHSIAADFPINDGTYSRKGTYNAQNVPGYLQGIYNALTNWNNAQSTADSAYRDYTNLLASNVSNNTPVTVSVNGHDMKFTTVSDVNNEYNALSTDASNEASVSSEASMLSSVASVNNGTSTVSELAASLAHNANAAQSKASYNAYVTMFANVLKLGENSSLSSTSNVSDENQTQASAAKSYSNVTSAASSVFASFANDNIGTKSAKGWAGAVTAASNKADQDQKIADNDYKTNVKTNNDETYQLISDVAEQQIYGTRSASDSNAISAANSNSAKLSGEISAANSTANSLKDNAQSAASDYNIKFILGNNPQLNEDTMNKLVPSAKAFVASVAAEGYLNGDTDAKSLSSDVSNISSAANNAGENYTKAVSASNSYAQAYDTDFVLASDYAYKYSTASSSDQSAYNSASAVRSNFYSNYAPDDFGSDVDKVNTYTPAIDHDGAFANAYAVNVQINEPHVVTVVKKAVLHTNPDYNMKDDQKLGVVPVGTHLKVENVGFDREGDTRLYVNYNGKHGFITGLRTYVKDSYLIPGARYSVTFNRNVNIYKSLQFNKGTYVKTLKAGTPVTGTAVRNDPGYYNGLTRLELDNNAGYVTTLDSTIKNADQLNGQNNSPAPKGAFFYNGQDHIPANYNA